MKYENLQRAHRLVKGYSQAERDLLKPYLPELPKQKTLDEIIEDVYEAYMCAEDEPNSNRLDEIHFQLTNWGKIPPVLETVFYEEEYESLPSGSVVLGEGSPWIKVDTRWHCAFGEIRGDRGMSDVAREVIRKGKIRV